jgi:hypothetical protein
MISPQAMETVAQRLALVGLNRCQAIAPSTLPPEVWLPGTGHPWPDEAEKTTLILVGHAGTALWDHLTDGDQQTTLDSTADPIDTFSINTTDAVIEEQWADVERRLLYPHPACPVDLVALGRAIGWQADSPLGLGIHPDWGPWSAFRALWILSAGLDSSSATPPTPTPDVCLTCETHDCVQACPADAVKVGRRFDLSACSDHRAEPASSCAVTCLARLACPVGTKHRYGREQMAYHYGISRPAERS